MAINRASQIQPKAKILMFGGYAVGKTINALQMPKPLLAVDTEKGSEHYKAFTGDFHAVNTRDLQLTEQLLAELENNGGKIPEKDDAGNPTGKEIQLTSLIVDSGSTIYDLVKDKYFRYYRKNNPFYNLEGADWGILKHHFKSNYIYRMLAMDLHMTLICREAKNYLEGSYMKRNLDEPFKADIEPSVLYDFDVVLHMQKTPSGIYRCEVKKTRLIDENGDSLLPEVIENIDRRTFMPWMIDLITQKKALSDNKKNTSVGTGANSSAAPIEVNVIKNKTAEELDRIKNEIKAILIDSKWDNDRVQNSLMDVVGVKSILIKEFTIDKAEKYLAYLRLIRDGNNIDQDETEPLEDEKVS